MIIEFMRIRLYHIIIASVYLILANPGLSAAQVFTFDGNRTRQTISFKQVKNLVVIPVMINGQGPYNFLLDTGVGQMIITDTALLKYVDVSQYRPVQIQGYGIGEGISAYMTRNITARVGKASISSIPTAIFKDDLFDLSGYLGIKIHGVLGYYFFNSFVVRINYKNNRLTFYTPDSKFKFKGRPYPMQIVKAKPYILATVQTLENETDSVRLLVDNGSSHPLLLESLHQGSFPLPDKHIPANLGVGINGVINGVMGRINSLKIGKDNFKDVLTGFPEFNPKRSEMEGIDRNGTLGAEILRHYLVTFDYNKNKIYLKSNGKLNTKFDHDMSGIEIYTVTDVNPVFYVGRIEPGSPADIAGIQTNDQLLSVDLKPVSTYTLSDLAELLKSSDGKQVLIEINRDKQKLIFLIKLKRRI